MATDGLREPPHRFQHSGTFQGGCMCGRPFNDPCHVENEGNSLREIAEQLCAPQPTGLTAIINSHERAMRLRDQAWRNSFGIVACPTEEKLNARMAELLKADK